MMRDIWGASLRKTAAVLNGSAVFHMQAKTVSPGTVRNYLRTTTWGRVAYKGDVKAFLSTKNIQDRIRFCEIVQREGYCQDTTEGLTLLSHVLFTDEAPVALASLPYRQNQRIRTTNVDTRVIQRHKNSLSIMVAGGRWDVG
jgi:hypothetical protein